MLLSTPPFFAFFVTVLLAFWAAWRHRVAQQAVLVLANLFFLLKFGPVYLLLVPAATVDFLLARAMAGQNRSDGQRRWLVLGSLVLNLGALLLVKALPLSPAAGYSWLLTLSLSFYCFQSLSYTLDVYRREAKPTASLLQYLGSALFFPSIVAGPIPRQARLLKQIAAPFRIDNEAASRALLLVAVGLVKKLLLADYLAGNLVDRVFDTPALYSGLENLIAVYGYALQLFMDFSGYTDMAMGVGLLLGIELPENFRRPYLAANLAEFWRRWHISFSDWLRDYVFDSLPKSRRFVRLSYAAGFVVTFLLGGLWHGLSWNFAIWGLLHGLALSAVFVWRRYRKGARPTMAGRAAGALLTFHYVCFTWIFFRAATLPEALAVLSRIGSHTVSAENLSAPVVGVLLLAAAAHSVPPESFALGERWTARLPFWAQGLGLAAVVLVIQSLAGQGSAPFVYGNF